jgi:hypothetical protein
MPTNNLEVEIQFGSSSRVYHYFSGGSNNAGVHVDPAKTDLKQFRCL